MVIYIYILIIYSTKISPTHKEVWKKLLCELDFVLIVLCYNLFHLMATKIVIPLANKRKKGIPHILETIVGY